jgi:hypothetical protein
VGMERGARGRREGIRKGERGVSAGNQRVHKWNGSRGLKKASGRIHRVYEMGAERERRCPKRSKR